MKKQFLIICKEGYALKDNILLVGEADRLSKSYVSGAPSNAIFFNAIRNITQYLFYGSVIGFDKAQCMAN